MIPARPSSARPVPRRGGCTATADRDARARTLAERAHRGQTEPSGRPYIDHVRRVAGMVPPFARRVAWLHDALEWTALDENGLRSAGLTADEVDAVRLLTREAGGADDAGFLDHVRAILRAQGRAGRIARAVKAADMRDRSLHPRDPRAAWSPPYGPARALLAGAPGDGTHDATPARAAPERRDRGETP